MKKRGFVKISGALVSHPKAKILNQALERHAVLNSWERIIVQFFEDGESLTKAVDFRHGVLLVACLSKELATKIKMFAQRIIYLLNAAVGKDLVFSLRVDF